MDSAVRTGTRLRTLLVRLAVTAGAVVAAWLISSLMAGSASASTSSGHAETDTTSSSQQQQGLLGGLLGGLTQTVGDVLGVGHGVHESDSDTPPAADSATDSATGSADDESSTETTLPELLSTSSSATGTASTMPAEPVRTSEPPAVKRESHTAAVQTSPARKATHAIERKHHATPKRATKPSPARPAPKPATVDTGNLVKAPVPIGPPAPQAPAAPSTALSAGHDGTAHGKSWFLTTAGDATLTPPTATGTAIDHRATAFARDRDRPATAPD